jgi:DNA-3-methyladenine glycosylase II
LPVVAPFRLDLTVSALRRLSTNAVDVFTPDDQYVHAFDGAHGPLIGRVAQRRPDALDVTIEGDPRDACQHGSILALIGRSLGVDRDLAPFSRAAASLPWLAPLAKRMRGVKPPRYRTLWEAFVNAVVFQQVSLQAASAVAGRLIQAFGTACESEGVPLHVFPAADRMLGASDEALRTAGLSAAKIATLRRAAELMASGALDEGMIEERTSADAAALLRDIKGIGPWTATVILLRGFGRLDVFPMNDSSVARNLALVAEDAPIDVPRMLAALQPQQGMLYYHLLLARLETRGEIGRASVAGA